MQPVLEQRLPLRLLHFPLAGVGALPALEADVADDLVDVVDDALDQDRRPLVAGLLEQLGQRRLAAFLRRGGRGGPLGLDHDEVVPHAEGAGRTLFDENVEQIEDGAAGPRTATIVDMEALAVVTAITSALAAAGALFNGWQIARLAGRVDALETDVRAINTRIDNILLTDRSRT